MESPLLSDGLYHFRARIGGQEQEHAVDVLCLRLTCEECEDAHRLPEDAEGRLKPTSAFLRELAGRFEELGVTGCTPSIAYQLWLAAPGVLGDLKKNTSETPSAPTGSESTPSD
ncbi:MAG: hypothetical protein WD872_17635 [Pirellulaceae bacterium]